MTAPAPPGVDARLDGFVRPDAPSDQRILSPVEELGDHLDSAQVRVHDARAAQEGIDAAAFFASHGFALVSHRSAVRDWRCDPMTPDPTSDVVRLYFPEIERIVREELLPGQKIDVQQFPLLRRGPGTENPIYGAGVHTDYGTTPEDYEASIAAFTMPEFATAWRAGYDRPEVRGALIINFWRTIDMTGPLEHMPLAVCDPSSVAAADIVPLGLTGFTPTGRPTNQLAVRANPEQRWFYYPRMRPDEVLAFKNFECRKDEPGSPLHACFHTAFEDPGAAPGAPERTSCEHRVQVWLLAD